MISDHKPLTIERIAFMASLSIFWFMAACFLVFAIQFLGLR